MKVLADGRRRFSCYVVMRDNVRIAVTAWLPPADLPAPYRTIATFTRYWRERLYDREISREITPANEAPIWNLWGYAVVSVDVRGTGASFGQRKMETPAEEIADYREIIDWIARESWSNGEVVTMGISYAANTALLAAIDPSPALKAVIARFVDIDAYEDLIAPGGLPNAMFLQDWGSYIGRLDRNDASVLAVADASAPRVVGIAPVDEDIDGRLLSAAIEEHHENYYIPDSLATVLDMPLVRDQFEAARQVGANPGSTIIANFDRFEANAIPTFIWASWMDAGTAAGALRWFSRTRVPGKVMIGAWCHGAGQGADPFLPPYKAATPDHPTQMEIIRNFLDGFLPSSRSCIPGRGVSYVTMGAGRWQESAVWPPEHVERMSLYLGEGSLSEDVPAAGTDRFVVDYRAGSGALTRWTTQLGGPIDYRDRRIEAGGLLRYAGAVLDMDVEITGAPVLDIHLESSHPDVALIAYLEDVAPDGRTTYLTEGVLRLLHRPQQPECEDPATGAPMRSFRAVDVKPLVPGLVERFRFAMLPLSALLKKGHRLQLAIAGADKDTFIRLPKDGNPELRIYRGAEFASAIILPVKRFGESQ